MYHKIEELPLCQCGCGAKAHIDIENLGQYSTNLLEQVMEEILRMTEPFMGILGCPAPTVDIEAQQSWAEERTRVLSLYGEPFQKVYTELEKRQSPKCLEDAMYGIFKIFEEFLSIKKKA